jgi:hypothetical protein
MDVLSKINPNLNYKLLFISSNNENKIKYKNINDKCVFITAPSSLDHIKESVLFYKKFGFYQKDIIYENEKIIECTINYKDDDINLCHMDINIH